jgi:hypothetical protein
MAKQDMELETLSLTCRFMSSHSRKKENCANLASSVASKKSGLTSIHVLSKTHKDFSHGTRQPTCPPPHYVVYYKTQRCAESNLLRYPQALAPNRRLWFLTGFLHVESL